MMIGMEFIYECEMPISLEIFINDNYFSYWHCLMFYALVRSAFYFGFLPCEKPPYVSSCPLQKLLEGKTKANNAF